MQSAVTAFVVKTAPESVPPHVPPTEIEYPNAAATVKLAVVPSGMICAESGVMVPLAPALGVTVRVMSVKVADTVRSFKEVVEGKHDEIPEQAFYMKGSIDDVLETWEDMKKKG